MFITTYQLFKTKNSNCRKIATKLSVKKTKLSKTNLIFCAFWIKIQKTESGGGGGGLTVL